VPLYSSRGSSCHLDSVRRPLVPICREGGWNLLRSYGVWFQTNSIIDCVAESLFAAQVAFRRLYRNVSQLKLNLLQFAASLMAQTGACPTHMPHAAYSPLCRIPDYAESPHEGAEGSVCSDSHAA
jgi:hypothetical protein